MTPEAASTLFSIPLGIFTNLASDKIQAFLSKNAYLATGLDDLFVNTFLATVKEHNKNFDSASKDSLKQLPQKIKRNKEAFLAVFGGIKTVHNLSDTAYIKKIARAISNKYKVSDNDLLFYIVQDCLSDYTRFFYAEMTEKQFMGIVLTDLFECTNNLNDALTVLSRIDERTAWVEQHYFRESLFKYYAQTNEGYRNSLIEYDDFIQRHYRELQLRGFTPHIGSSAVAMELEDIFVPLNINRESSISSDRQINSINKNEPESLLRYQRSVLLGKPGSGKSTILKHIAVSISSNRNSTEGLDKCIVPIIFKVSEYAESYKLKQVNLHDFLCNRIETKFKDFLNSALLCSNALILVDGLDEVTDKALRLKIADRIEEFISTYPKCQCVITSRIIGYNEVRLGCGFEHFQLDDFNEEQIKRFSEKWIEAIHKGQSKEEIARESTDLFESISRNNSVYKLATNPLLMTIIAMIYFKGRRLPNSRIELYEFSTETFLESWVRLRVMSDSQLKSKNDIIEILCPIAYHIHKTKSDACIGESELFEKFELYYKGYHTSASIETVKNETREFIAFLREQTGFFYEVGVSETGENLFSFMHLTFEEYFAGMFLANDFNDGGTRWKDAVNSSRWTEILRLAAAHLSAHMRRNKTTEFIDAVMEFPEDFPEIGRKEALLIQLFSDDIIVSDDCKLVALEKMVRYLSSRWACANLNISALPLLRSNFRKEFWEMCLSEALSTDDEQICQSALPDAIFDYIRLYSSEYADDIKDFLNKISIKVLICLYWNKRIIKSEVFEIPDCYIEVVSNRLSELSLDDPNFLNRFTDNLDSKRLQILADELTKQVSKLNHEALRTIYIVAQCDILSNGLKDMSRFISSELLTEEENIFITQFKSYHSDNNINHYYTGIVNIDNHSWRLLFGFEESRLYIDILKTNPFEQWHFCLEAARFTESDSKALNDFPSKIQTIIYSMLMRIYSKKPIYSQQIFSRLKELGLDVKILWGLEDYIALHVNEDSCLDSLFLARCNYFRNERDSRFSEIDFLGLTKPFSYEPSPPLKACILVENKQKIEKELLLEIRDYALSADSEVQLPAMKILDYLVSKDDIN